MSEYSVANTFAADADIVAADLQENFDDARAALEDLDSDNFEDASIPREVLVAREPIQCLELTIATIEAAGGEDGASESLVYIAEVVQSDWTIIGLHLRQNSGFTWPDGMTLQLRRSRTSGGVSLGEPVGPAIGAPADDTDTFRWFPMGPVVVPVGFRIILQVGDGSGHDAVVEGAALGLYFRTPLVAS